MEEKLPGNGLFFSNLQLLFSYDDHNNGSSFLFQDPNGAVKYYTQHPKLHSTKSGSVVWVATKASKFIATDIDPIYVWPWADEQSDDSFGNNSA